MARSDRVSLALVFALVAVLAVVANGATAAREPTLYTHSAKRLVPSAAEAGFESLTSQSAKALGSKPKPGLLSSWTSDYKSSDKVGVVGVMVFRSEATARVIYDDACSGCDPQVLYRGWRFKRAFEISPVGRNWPVVTLIAHCRNLVVTATRSAGDNKQHLTTEVKPVIEGILARAAALGMTACKPRPTPPPPGLFARGSATGRGARVVAAGTIRRPGTILARIRVTGGKQEVDVDWVIVCTKNGVSESTNERGYVEAPVLLKIRQPVVAPDSCNVTFAAQLRGEQTISIELGSIG
jgi:hypothetical protein